MTNPTSQTARKTRPPIVVVLGHVDHGKTSLLDVVRQTNVIAKESGGITQHIGAYQTVVELPRNARDDFSASRKITFLDTPGHEAFTAIRSRGAKVADVAVLVVAADESVKLQTAEAAAIIKEEKIPCIVAINKIDKPGANIQKVKQDLAGIDILVEDWGGSVPVVEVSAKEGRNIPALLEMILLVADLEDLKEDLSLPAKGVIIESNLDKRRGYVATALAQKGILSVGDWLVAGSVIGKVKSMEDFLGKPLTAARPSQPVLITGWTNAPEIGREFAAAYSKDEAQSLAAENIDLTPLFSFLRTSETDIDPNKKYLKLVIKTDVSSSLEAIENSLKQIKSDEVAYSVLSYDIGAVSEADVKTAKAGGGQVIGFRVPVESSAQKLSEKEQVLVTPFDVIYELIEHVRKGMGALLAPEVTRVQLAKVKILAVFKKDARFQIVGGKVISGKLLRGAMADMIRNGDTVMTGKVAQVQQNKEDIPEVAEGLEAGIRFEPLGAKTVDIAAGDILEVYQEEKSERSL